MVYYERDGITLYHGDCREILPRLGPVDAVVTDPPYGIGFGAYDRHRDAAASYADDVLAAIWLAEAHVPRGWCAVFQSATTARHWSERFPRAWRLIALPKTFVQIPGGRGHFPYHATDYVLAWPIGEPEWPPKRPAPRDWFLCQTADMSRRVPGHPCPRPPAALRYLIEAFVPPGGLVLDPFAGSGTTLRAALDLGRSAIGIEISADYCAVAVRELAQGALFAAQATSR